MKWILALLQIFVKTLTVNVNIDLRLKSIKGYVDGIKLLNVNFQTNSFDYSLSKFRIVLSDEPEQIGVVTIYFCDKQIWQSSQYQNISLLYHNKQISINGFIIPII